MPVTSRTGCMYLKKSHTDSKILCGSCLPHRNVGGTPSLLAICKRRIISIALAVLIAAPPILSINPHVYADEVSASKIEDSSALITDVSTESKIDDIKGEEWADNGHSSDVEKLVANDVSKEFSTEHNPASNIASTIDTIDNEEEQVPCYHLVHDPQNGVCSYCGIVVPHSFVDGVCVRCGSKPNLYEDWLPQEYYEPSSKPGTIDLHEYNTLTRCGNGWLMSKSVLVYVPYGYDPSVQYNVMILLHGKNGDHNDWFNRDFYIQGHAMNGKNVLDHMIEAGIIEPTIFVTMNTQGLMYGMTLEEEGPDQLGYEIQADVLPLIVENYSTYAKDITDASLIEAREHFGIGGLSLGSYYTWSAGIGVCLPYFANFMCLSGMLGGEVRANNAMSELLEIYPISMLYVSMGTSESKRTENKSIAYNILNTHSELAEGVNFLYHESLGGHNWKTWFIELANAMPLMFSDKTATSIDDRIGEDSEAKIVEEVNARWASMFAAADEDDR